MNWGVWLTRLWLAGSVFRMRRWLARRLASAEKRGLLLLCWQPDVLAWLDLAGLGWNADQAEQVAFEGSELAAKLDAVAPVCGQIDQQT